MTGFTGLLSRTLYGEKKAQPEKIPESPSPREPESPRVDTVFPEKQSRTSRVWNAFKPWIPPVAIVVGAVAEQFYTILSVLPVNTATKFIVAGAGAYSIVKGTSEVFEGSRTIGAVAQNLLTKKKDAKIAEPLLHGASKILNGAMYGVGGYMCYKTFQRMEALQVQTTTEKWTAEQCTKEYPLAQDQCRKEFPITEGEYLSKCPISEQPKCEQKIVYQEVIKEVTKEVSQPITEEACKTQFPCPTPVDCLREPPKIEEKKWLGK